MDYHGKAQKVGDHVDTDAIIPARFLVTADAGKLGKNCMAGLEPDWARRVRKGDILVAGRNFGCGSSREHAPIAIKAAGVSCVIAKTFARIFYRNSLNIGLPILECPEACDAIENGDEVAVDFDSGVITNVTKGTSYKAQPFPEFIQNIISKGGLLASLKH